ncbi:hypothetical protein ACFV1L_05540 [Kitasatospora sp. NPDC059646]|uniref:hypothetical protein n=1 Tax=Kitasatospora sp. NPDC059646 TaxID=3346893 RepID=UPI00367F9C2D
MPARAVSGPYRIWVTLLCAATPVLTLGILGMVPSVVLAVGRRRRADIVGAVVIGLMQLVLFVEVGLTPSGGKINNLVGVFLLIPLWIGTPVHFLLMNQRRFWPQPATPPPGYGYPGHPATGVTHPYELPYPRTAPYPQAGPYPAPPAPFPGVATPPPAAPQAGPTGATGATGAAELRELGELLRRQAGDGQP